MTLVSKTKSYLMPDRLGIITDWRDRAYSVALEQSQSVQLYLQVSQEEIRPYFVDVVTGGPPGTEELLQFFEGGDVSCAWLEARGAQCLCPGHARARARPAPGSQRHRAGRWGAASTRSSHGAPGDGLGQVLGRSSWHCAHTATSPSPLPRAWPGRHGQ